MEAASGTRPIRSYVLRQGRVSNAQQRAWEALLPRYGIPFSGRRCSISMHAFGRAAPKMLEIGFGMGETTATIAAATRRTTTSASKCTRPASAAC